MEGPQEQARVKPQFLKEELSAIKVPVIVHGTSNVRSEIIDCGAGQVKLWEAYKLDKIESRMLPTG